MSAAIETGSGPNTKDALFERVERILAPNSGGVFAAAESPVAAAIRAVAKTFGCKPDGDVVVIAGETLDEAVERIGRCAGLLTREIAVEQGWQGRFALPFIVERASDGAPIAVLPSTKGWLYVDGTKPRTPLKLTAEVEATFSTRGWVASQTFPDKAIRKRDVFKFGFRTKLPELFAFMFLTAFAGTVLVLLPLAANTVIDMVVPGRDLELLGHVVAMFVALVAGAIIAKAGAALAELRLEGRIAIGLRAAAADRMIRIKRNPFAGPPVAAATLITRSTEGWHRAVWKLLLQVIGAFLIAFPSLIIVMQTAPMAAAYCLLAMIIAVSYSAWIGWRQIEELFSGASSPSSWVSVSYETLANIETVRASAAEDRKFKMFAESFLALKEKFLSTGRLGARLAALESALEAIILTIGIAAAVLLYPTMPSQQGVVFATAMLVVTGAAIALVQAFQQAAPIGLQQRLIQPLLEGVPAPHRTGNAPPTLAGAIIVDSITVSTAHKSHLILDGVSLQIAAGQQVAIVGPSGSGKTTLLRALLGMEALDVGAIRYDGIDLALVDKQALRRQIGVVGQAARLFPGTLRENIEAGLHLDEGLIMDAVRMAAFDADLASLPLGLSTPVGDGDVVLSGGQVQRVLLARAFAARPKVLFLDEATSALDARAEAHVARSIASLGATVITVAHRLDTVRHCDVIHVLDRGKVVETGTFDTLSRSGGHLDAFVSADRRAVAHVSVNPVADRLDTLRARLGATTAD